MKNHSLNRKERGSGGLPKIRGMRECYIYLLAGQKAFLVGDVTEIQSVITFQLFIFGAILPQQFAFITFQQEKFNFKTPLATIAWLPPFLCYWLPEEYTMLKPVTALRENAVYCFSSNSLQSWTIPQGIKNKAVFN